MCREPGSGRARRAGCSRQAAADQIRIFQAGPWNSLFTVTRNKLNSFLAHRARRKNQGSGRTSIHEVLREQPDAAESEEWEREYRQHLFEWAARQVRGEFEGATWKAFVLVAVEGRTVADASHLVDYSIDIAR